MRATAPHGIRVNAICPEIVVGTAMRMAIESQQRHYRLPETAEREKSIAIGRGSVPEDVARVAAFLVFRPNHMIHQRGGVGRVEQRKPIATSAGDGFRSKAGQGIHGWLDRRRASFETTAFRGLLRMRNSLNAIKALPSS